MDQLAELCVWHSTVNGPRPAHLHNLSRLKVLSLEDADIGDDDLRQLRRIRWLESLNLAKARLSDRAMSRLGELKMLRYLYLYWTNITDDNLRYLRGLCNLEELSLLNTKITKRRARPSQRTGRSPVS